MNAKDRKDVKNWIDTLSNIKSKVEELQQDQQDKCDNLPFSLQCSDFGASFDDAANALEEAADAIENAIDELQEII